MGKHLVYPRGCSCFPSWEWAWKQQQWRDIVNELADASNAQCTWNQQLWSVAVIIPALTEPLASPPCCRSPWAGVGRAGFQGAVSGVEIYAVFDKKNLCFSSSCSQLVCCREAVVVRCLFLSPTCFGLDLGIRCPGMQGIAPVQGNNILLKYFLPIKMTTTSLRLLPAHLWSRAKNKFLMCSIFLFMTWKAAHRAA